MGFEHFIGPLENNGIGCLVILQVNYHKVQVPYTEEIEMVVVGYAIVTAIVGLVLETTDAEIVVEQVSPKKLIVIANSDAVGSTHRPLGQRGSLEQAQRGFGTLPFFLTQIAQQDNIAQMGHKSDVLFQSLIHDPLCLAGENSRVDATQFSTGVVLRIRQCYHGKGWCDGVQDLPAIECDAQRVLVRIIDRHREGD